MAGEGNYGLDDYLVDFLQSGIPIQLGTRNAFNKTAFTRSWGCKVNDDRRSMILFLYASHCDQALQNIRDNGVYAATFVNVYNYECYQVKGSGATVLQDLSPYGAVLAHFQQSMSELVSHLGLPQKAVDNMAGRSLEDYLPVHCPIDACYRQTPGPGAGNPVSPA